jgi:hypothetical protein
MMATSWLRTLGIGKYILRTAPVAALTADQFGVPWAARAGEVIRAAQERGGTGSERMAFAVESMIEDAPPLIEALEKQLGRPISGEAALDYIEAQLQAHYDLMRAVGVLKK